MARKELVNAIFNNKLDAAKQIARSLTSFEVNQSIDAWDSHGRSVIHYASDKTDKEWASLVEVLLDVGCNPEVPTFNGWTALHVSSNRMNAYSTQALILHGKANVNAMTYHMYTPLHMASVACDTSTMGLLLRHGANVNAINKWNQSPLELSMGKTAEDGTDKDRVAAQKLLLKHGGLTGSDYQKKCYNQFKKAGTGNFNSKRSSFFE